MPDTNVNSEDSAVEETIRPLYEDLNEQQLREIYDNHEINRFLHIFSTSVTEVHRLPQEQSRAESADRVDDSSQPEQGDIEHRVYSQADSENTISTLPSSWAESFLLPTAPPRPAFTLGRLKVAIQRLYLAIVPVYGPFFSTLIELATWQNRKKSLVYCSVYWILWYHNILLPAMLLRILFSLLRRRVLPYPTVKELRDHQVQVRRSYELGEEVNTRLSASSTLGLNEIGRIIKIISSVRKSRTKVLKKDKLPPKQGEAVAEDGRIDNDEAKVPDSTTVLDVLPEDETEANLKRDILYGLDMTADLHERIRNIFIWRDPPSSRLYGIVIFCLFFVTLVLPAKYLAKLVYFILGVCFWHVMPIAATLPPTALARIPPPFSDVPTDADYAMKLISQQALAGLRVTPGRPKAAPISVPEAITAGNDLKTRNVADSTDGVNWKKWGEKLASSKTLVTNGRQILIEEHPSLASRVSKLSTILTPGQASSEQITQSFPAYNISTPGLITITLSHVCFTPLLSAYPTKTIPIDSIRSVKKSGMLKGLAVLWVDTQQNEATQEEKFRWVGGRDELFARLLGLASKEQRWRRA